MHSVNEQVVSTGLGITPLLQTHRAVNRLELQMPSNTTILAFSDLHLRPVATVATDLVAAEIEARLAGVTGSGVVVLNGDTFELWGEPDSDVDAVLDAHPRLLSALARFGAAADRHVVLLVGNHDARFAWDDDQARSVAERLCGCCTLMLDLTVDTPDGPQLVRFEHGHAYDPVNALRDPRNPLDSPLGQHVVQEVLPQLIRTPLLQDIGSLAQASTGAQFVVSRMLYRQIGHRLWWLLVPLLVSVGLRLPFVLRALIGPSGGGSVPGWIPVAAVGVAVDVVGLFLVLGLLSRSVYAAVAGTSARPGGIQSNGAPAAAAESLCAEGFAGLVTGHTHAPELTPVAGGFYANTGCALRCIERRPAHLGLPPVFVPMYRMSWLELDVDNELRVRLLLSEQATGENTWLERLALRGRLPKESGAKVVAELPGHAGYPLRSLDLDRRRHQERVRGIAALAVAGVGLLSFASALTWPLQGRLRALLELFPVEVPQAAAATVMFLSVALILLGRGLRRGHRLAWGLAIGLLVSAAVLHLVKGLDLEESLVAGLVAGWLARNREAFPVCTSGRYRRLPAVLLIGGLLALGTSVGLVFLTGQLGVSGDSAEDLAALLARPGSGLFPGPPLLTPALYAAGFAALMGIGLLLTRKQMERPTTAGQHLADRERARELVLRHGGDTLAYFALRDDKSWFFTGDSVVAYSIRDGVCLVSPDPIGPPQEWAAAWADFTRFADRHGWPVAVIGAGAGWLPVYEAAGFRSMYMGDEAIVNCQSFTLQGRPMKQLRSACSRARRAGYTVRFHDPADLPEELAGRLREVLTQSRRGQVERGFSMTLSRMLDAKDTGMLLSVVYRADGRPAAFCQWVPATGISGWSLDLMRRAADEDVPNGLIEFLLIETIEHVRRSGQWGLSLNFAVMRAVLAGEQGDGVLTELQARVLNKFSDSMQIASLWHFNQKFDPLWRPRYIAVGRLSSAPVQTLAIADAEGVTELPLIGRFLGRTHRRAG